LLQLIGQLGSQKFGERRAAARALDRLGPAALPALRLAARSDDPEVSRRARALIKSINKRVERDRLLAATRVRLVYKDTPVPQAVADFAKKTGFAIRLGYDERTLADRKITLDTGDTSFWQAFDQFCAGSRLVERGLALVTTNTKAVHLDLLNQAKADPALVLYDVKPPGSATYYFLGMRIRAFPASVPLDGLHKAEGEKVIVLEASLEPRTRLHKLIDVSIGKATSEQGRGAAVLTTLLHDSLNSNTMGRYMREPHPRYLAQLETGMHEGNFRRVLLRVHGASRLSELEGVLLAEVEKPVGAIATVKDILKVNNQSFELPDSGLLTITEAKREKNGEVRVEIQVQFPMRGINGVRVINGLWQVRRPFSCEWKTLGLNPSQIKLLDSRDRAFRQARTQSRGVTFGGGGLSQRLTLIYQPMDGQAGAAKLLCYGVGTAVVEVPFTLKNVILPEK
jgi:hypothetical protein